MDTVFVGIPVYDKMTSETRMMLKFLYRYTKNLRLIEPYEMLNQSCIPFARNEIAEVFLTTQADYLMFIDADIYIRDPAYYNAIERLHDHKKQVIGGVYTCKNPPFQPAIATVKKFEGGGAYYERFDRMANPLKVPMVANGFLLIRRDVLELVGANPFNLRYWKKAGLEKNQMPEDYSFCDLLSEHKITPWVDTQIPLLHVGVYYYGLNDFYGMCEYNLKLRIGDKLPPLQASI